MTQDTPPPAVESVAPPPPDQAQASAQQYAMFCHLSGLAFFLSIPFANVIAPLILWLIKKDQHPYINEHGKEVVNFQISMSIYITGASVVCFLMFFILIGMILLPLAGLAFLVIELIFVIKGAIAANKGQSYSYPLTIRFLK